MNESQELVHSRCCQKFKLTNKPMSSLKAKKEYIHVQHGC